MTCDHIIGFEVAGPEVSINQASRGWSMPENKPYDQEPYKHYEEVCRFVFCPLCGERLQWLGDGKVAA